MFQNGTSERVRQSRNESIVFASPAIAVDGYKRLTLALDTSKSRILPPWLIIRSLSLQLACCQRLLFPRSQPQAAAQPTRSAKPSQYVLI